MKPFNEDTVESDFVSSGQIESDLYVIVSVSSKETELKKGDIVIAPRFAGYKIFVGGEFATAIQTNSLIAK